MRKVNIGNVGGFSVRQRVLPRLDVGTLHQPDLDTSCYQAFHIAGCPMEIGLHGGAEPVCQPLLGGGQDALKYWFGTGNVFCPDLYTSPGR